MNGEAEGFRRATAAYPFWDWIIRRGLGVSCRHVVLLGCPCRARRPIAMEGRGRHDILHSGEMNATRETRVVR
jgi:hypothetical protein